MYKEVIERGDCLSLKELSVTGGDLMELGIKPGPFLGEILNKLFEDVLDVPEHNTKEWLINRASVYFKQLTGAEQDA